MTESLAPPPRSTIMLVPQTRRRAKALAVVAVALLVLAGGAAYLYRHYVSVSVVRYTVEHGKVTVSAGTVSGLGTVLVTNKGYALYMFPPDAASRVSCTGGCADAWPPLTVPDGDTVAAGARVRPGLLGTAPNPGGGRVVTYHGWPLYTYLGDASPGHASPGHASPGHASPGHAAGLGLDEDGGFWYAMRPSGQIVRR